MSETESRGLVGKIAALQNIEEYLELNWSGSFEQYLDIVRKTPEVTRTAFQRAYDMIIGYGTEEYIDNKKRITRFRFFETVQLYQAGQQLSEVTVWKGMQDLVNLGIQDQLFVTIPRGRYDDLVARINVQPQLSAPLAAGQQVGMVSVYLDDKVIFDRPLVTLQQIEEAGFFGRNWDSLVIWVNGLFEDDEQ